MELSQLNGGDMSQFHTGVTIKTILRWECHNYIEIELSQVVRGGIVTTLLRKKQIVKMWEEKRLMYVNCWCYMWLIMLLKEKLVNVFTVWKPSNE